MESNNKNDLILTKQLTKVYSDDGVPVEAIDQIDLKIQSGEFTAIVGPSGSGKTTLFYHMCCCRI